MPVVVPQPRTQSERTSDNPVRTNQNVLDFQKIFIAIQPTAAANQFPIVGLQFS